MTPCKDNVCQNGALCLSGELSSTTLQVTMDWSSGQQHDLNHSSKSHQPDKKHKQFAMNHYIAPHDNWPLAIKLMNVSYLIECFCKPDYHGVFCQEKYDDCIGVNCLNDGKCIDSINDYNCECLNNFAGKNCEINCKYLESDHRYVDYIDSCSKNNSQSSTDHPPSTEEITINEEEILTTGHSVLRTTTPLIPNPIDFGSDNDLPPIEDSNDQGNVIKKGNLPKLNVSNWTEVNEVVTSGTPLTTLTEIGTSTEEIVTSTTDQKDLIDPTTDQTTDGIKNQEKNGGKHKEEVDSNDHKFFSSNGHHNEHSSPQIDSFTLANTVVFPTVTIDATPVVVIDPTTVVKLSSVYKDNPVVGIHSSIIIPSPSSATTGHHLTIPDPINHSDDEDNFIEPPPNHHDHLWTPTFVLPSFTVNPVPISVTPSLSNVPLSPSLIVIISTTTVLVPCTKGQEQDSITSEIQSQLLTSSAVAKEEDSSKRDESNFLSLIYPLISSSSSVPSSSPLLLSSAFLLPSSFSLSPNDQIELPSNYPFPSSSLSPLPSFSIPSGTSIPSMTQSVDPTTTSTNVVIDWKERDTK